MAMQAETLATLLWAGIRVVMATVVGLTTTRAFGPRLGIEEVQGEVAPADKLKLVEQLLVKGDLRGIATATALSVQRRPPALIKAPRCRPRA